MPYECCRPEAAARNPRLSLATAAELWNRLGPMPIEPDDLAAALSMPRELAADPARQAVASIRGYIYQIWWSVDAWLRLQSLDEAIYLEGAEDLDNVRSDGATTEQIK